jgi:hypothetical protein
VPGVTATPFVGLVLKTVAGRNGTLDRGRSPLGRIRNAILQQGRAAMLESVTHRLPRLYLAGAGNHRSTDREQGNNENSELFHGRKNN